MVESSIVMYDKCIIDYQKGNVASVDFDFIKIWEFCKLLDEDFNPRKLHFYHVHPESFGTQMSSLDENCLKGFSIAFDYPVKFSILTFPIEESFYKMSTYYYSEERNTILLHDKENIPTKGFKILKKLSREGIK